MNKAFLLGVLLTLGGIASCGTTENPKEEQINSYGSKFEDYSQVDLKKLESLANQNDALAQTELALRTLMGLRGVAEKNPKVGMMWLEKAAGTGEVEAIYQLSELYITPSLSGGIFNETSCHHRHGRDFARRQQPARLLGQPQGRRLRRRPHHQIRYRGFQGQGRGRGQGF